jgi:hypothetical protein
MLDLLDIFEIVKGILFDAEPPFLDTSVSTRFNELPSKILCLVVEEFFIAVATTVVAWAYM